MKRTFIILFLLIGLGLSTESFAQSGARKRERGGSVKKKTTFSLKRNRSAGNADRFARSKGRKGKFARLFRKDQPAWTNKSTGNPKRNWRDNKFLFSRHRTPGKVENSTYLERQNAKRARKRVKGNDSIKSRKYKRK